MARARSADAPKKGLPWAQRLGGSVGRGLRPLLPLLVLGALYTAAASGLWLPVRNDPQSTLTRERLLPPLLNARPRPAWIPESEWRKLAQTALAVEGRSVFEPGVAAALARTYESSPWIETVGEVRLHYPARVSLGRVAPRVPFARLDADGCPLVVDHKGFVLPMSAGDLAAPGPRPAALGCWIELPSVTGVRCRRVSGGEQVTEPEAQEGLALLEAVNEILARAPGAVRVARVQREPAGTWRVLTGDGPMIEWGYWDDERRPEGEPCAREKREALTRSLTEWDPRRLRYIRLDQPRAPVAPR